MSYTGGIPVPYLRAWRRRSLMTQRRLASVSGVNRHTILFLENGRWKGAQIRTIEKIAHALDITPYQLIEGPEEPS